MRDDSASDVSLSTVPAEVDLCLTVRRRRDGQPGETLATTAGVVPSARASGGVPTAPVRPVVRTKDEISIQVSASQPGYVTVFNITPAGELSVLYPKEPLDERSPPPPTPANQPIHVMDVALTPPAGSEKLFAVWNARARNLGEYQLRELARRGELPSHGSTRVVTRSTRSYVEPQGSDERGNWIVVALELDHQE